MHGGKSPGRPIVHGRNSKVWALRMQEKIDRARADPTIFNQHKRFAVLDAIFDEAVEEYLLVCDGDNAEMWADAITAFTAVQSAIAEQDAKALAKSLGDLEAVLRNGRKREHVEEKLERLGKTAADISRVQIQGMKSAADVITAREKELFKARVVAEVRSIPVPDDHRELYNQHLRLFLAAFVKAAG